MLSLSHLVSRLAAIARLAARLLNDPRAQHSGAVDFCLRCSLLWVALPTLDAATQLSNAGYAISTWQTEDGLPQNSVTAIAQTNDGYIWVGTYGGLARFDGVNFRTFDNVASPELQDTRIVSLHVDRQDRLWIGHDSGKLSRYSNGRFQAVPLQGRPAESKIAALTSDAQGDLWALTDEGDLENVSTHRILRPATLQGAPRIASLLSDQAGQVWMAIDGNLYSIEKDKLQEHDLGSATYSGFVTGVGPAKNGGLWLARDTFVRRFENGTWKTDPRPALWGDSSVTAILELKNGDIAVGTIDRGLYILNRDGGFAHITHTNGLPQDWIRCLFEDREGNLWIGDGTGGLAMLHPTPLSLLNSPDQWQGRTVLSVAATRDGALWIGTEGAGLYEYNGGKWSHFGESEGLENLFIWSITEGKAGELWVGTWGTGVYQMRERRLVQRPELDPTSAPAFALTYTESDQTLWIGTAAGLLYYRNGSAHKSGDLPPNIAPSVSSLAPKSPTAMWVGLRDAGLGDFDEGHWKVYGRNEGLSTRSVQCLLTDSDGALWVGTADGGLNRLKDGRAATIGVREGLSSNAICHIADDGLGNLWLSTHRGILRIQKVDLNRCADGLSPTVAAQVFDREDGLPTVEFSGGLQAAGCETTDGRLWFTSNKGLVAVDPKKVSKNNLPPPVKIEAARGDGRSLALTGQVVLPPENQRFEVDYTALSFTAPHKVRFKYKLEGFEKDWTDAGTKRTATYSHLPAGAYRLRVIAANNDGVWNAEGATLDLTVLPFFWQRAWFIALVATLGFLGIVAAARYEARRRMHRKLERLERQRVIEGERTRIARDIHDDIGSSLTRITMLSQAARSDATEEQKNSALHHIYGTARELTRSLDEIVWAVDPRHDTLESLALYISRFAQDFLSAAGVRCRLDIPVSLPPWTLSTQTRHHLFLAFKEALNNAVKHAEATEVKVALTTGDDNFILTVEDNGRGFSINPALTHIEPAHPLQGDGLVNMQRRLTGIGGECTIDSHQQGGTRVSFRCRRDLAPAASP